MKRDAQHSTARAAHRRPGAFVPGAVSALVLGLACGMALRPTPAESGLPRPPQLICLSDGELVQFEAAAPGVWWPSVASDGRV